MFNQPDLCSLGLLQMFFLHQFVDVNQFVIMSTMVGNQTFEQSKIHS